MAKQPTLAEQTAQLLDEARGMYRESFLLCWETLTEGWPELVRKKILRFFTTETTPVYWNELADRDDAERARLQQQETQGLVPPGTAAAFVGEAQSQLAQWMLLDPDAAIEEAA